MLKALIAGAAAVTMLTSATIASNTTADKQILGGWDTKETSITEEAQEVFDEATAALIGVNYEAKELIGKQIVNGTNYKFIAESQVVYPGAEKKEVEITIHKALDGTVTILDIVNE